MCTACGHGTPRPLEAVYHAPRVMSGAAENTQRADGLLLLSRELTLSWELIKTHEKESEDPKNRARWSHGQGPRGQTQRYVTQSPCKEGLRPGCWERDQ